MPLDTATLLQILIALAVSWGRMAAALIISILFSIAVGVAAGRNPLLEKIIIPVLDLLQSIPILSFFPLALYAFTVIHPLIGPELAALFLIFTSQAWNIAFGVYEAMRLLPAELLETSRVLGLGPARRLLNLYFPAAFPKIASNLPASWSNGLYFLVASEIISMGEKEVRLFGIGSLSASFIASGGYLELGVSLAAVAAAVVLTNLLFFLPLIRMSERYVYEQVGVEVPRVWIERAARPVKEAISKALSKTKLPGYEALVGALKGFSERVGKHLIHVGVVVGVGVLAILLYCVTAAVRGVLNPLSLLEGFRKLGLEAFTMLGFSAARVATVIALTMAWALPLTILLHERRRLESLVIPSFQVVASMPSTLLAPLVMNLASEAGLPLELGAVVIILLGVQWYIFFFLYDGVRRVPFEEDEVCRLLKIKGFSKFRHLYLPRLLPSLVMGCWVAMGGGWNTLIIAERLVVEGVEWAVEGPGIGKALSLAVSAGDLPTLVAATIWMAGSIVVLHRLLWRRLYQLAVKKVKIT